MDLRWPWLLVLLVAGVLALLVWWGRPTRPPTTAAGLHVAHVRRLRQLPRYRQLRRRRAAGLVYLTLGSLLAVCGAVLLASRPQSVQVERPSRERDVMLCLDASGSMDPYNERVVAEVKAILDELEGARAGLTIFSGAAITVVPLTEDLDFVTDQLDLAAQSFASTGIDFFAGIDLADRKRASLLGDGIASCADRFDRLDEDRARSVVVTSDNDPLGRALYTPLEGAAIAADREVVVHAIAAPTTTPPAAAEMRDAVAVTGGTFATLDSDGTAAQVVARIEDRESRRTVLPPRTVLTDSPAGGIVMTAAGMAVLVTGWTVRAAVFLLRRRT